MIRGSSEDEGPELEDRNGRHRMRVEMGTILMKFAIDISVQLWPNVTTKAQWPAPGIPVIFSAGGALRACDDDLLPEPEDRNGRHWMRVEMGTILMKFALDISVQLWSPL